MPKSRLADRSTASQVSSSRSAIGLPHVRHGGAGGDRPVHPAHVVARAVLPRLPRLAARPGQQAQVVALQQPVQLAGDQQLQPGQRRLGRTRAAAAGRPAWLAAAPRLTARRRSAGTGSRRGRPGRAAGHPAGGRLALWRGATVGSGTRRSTRLDDVVGRDVVGERVVGEHQPVAQDVGRDVLHVLRQRVVAAAQQRQRPGGPDDAERGARAGAVLDQLGDVGQAVLGRARGWPAPAAPRSRPARCGRTPRRPSAAARPASAGVEAPRRLAAALTPIR